MSSKKDFMLLGILCLALLLVLPMLAARAGAETPKPIIWRWNCQYGSASAVAESNNLFCKRVKERSGGRLIVEMYYSGAMGIGFNETFPALKAGACDIAYSPGCININYEPILGWSRVPFLHTSGSAYMDFFNNKFKPIRDKIREKWGNKMFIEWAAAGPEGASQLFSKKPIKCADDFKGRPIRTGGGYITEIFKAIGAHPFTISTSELYTAVQRGMVDTVATSYLSATDCKFWEILKYVNHIPFEYMRDGVAMSLKSFNSLPKDLQEIVWECAKENERYRAEIHKSLEAKLLKMLTDGGMQEIWPEEGTMETLRERAMPRIRKFAEDTGPQAVEWLKELGVW